MNTEEGRRIEALEADLDEARREIERLRGQVADYDQQYRTAIDRRVTAEHERAVYTVDQEIYLGIAVREGRTWHTMDRRKHKSLAAAAEHLARRADSRGA